MTAADIIAMFPESTSFNLTYNEHKAQTQTVQEWLNELDQEGESDLYEWVSEEQMRKAIETDSVWTLQWYPGAADGFYAMAAADLDALLEAARSVVLEH